MIYIICTLNADDKPPSKESRAFFDFRVDVRQEWKLCKSFRKWKFIFFYLDKLTICY